MRLICPQGHNKLETGYHTDGKCAVCKRHRTKIWANMNPEKVRGYHAKSMNRYRKTLRGFLDQKYTAMSERVRGKDDRCVRTSTGLPIMSRKDFLVWAYQQPELAMMFEAYRASNWEFKLCPTIDRVDYTEGYILGNIRFLTQSDNSHRNKGRPKNWRTGL